MHVISLAIGSEISIHPFWVAQLASLIANEVSVTIFAEYSNFTDVFLSKFTVELREYFENNNHPIELIDS